MSAASLVWWQADLIRAFEAAGHRAIVRRNRNGSPRVTLDNRPETDMRRALVRIEATLTRERAWPWMRGAA